MSSDSKKKVLISLKLPDVARELLTDAGFEVSSWEKDELMTREEFISLSKTHNAVLSTGTYKIDKDFLSQCKHLDIVSQYAVGYDNMDVQTAATNNIVLANIPGTMTDATADIAFALLLGVARNMFYLQNTIVKGEWKNFNAVKNLGVELKNKTLGIFGLGRIGIEMAKRCLGAYNMQIIYHNRSRNQKAEDSLGAKYVNFDTLLSESDVISAHCNLTKETRYTFDKQAFAKMKSTAIFINTARGAVHQESDLIEALQNKQIWGAGLDVTDPEPMSPDNPLLKMKNVMVLPHVGSGTIEARHDMASLASRNIISFYKTGKPIHQINA